MGSNRTTAAQSPGLCVHLAETQLVQDMCCHWMHPALLCKAAQPRCAPVPGSITTEHNGSRTHIAALRSAGVRCTQHPLMSQMRASLWQASTCPLQRRNYIGHTGVAGPLSGVPLLFPVLGGEPTCGPLPRGSTTLAAPHATHSAGADPRPVGLM